MFLKETDIGKLILGSIAPESSITKKASSKINATDVSRMANGLTKVASYPYKDEVYTSVQEMMKQASSFISDLYQQFDSANTKASNLEKTAAVRSVIDEMKDVGIVGDDNIQEKIAELSKKSDRELEIIKEAIKLTSSGNDGVFFDQDKVAEVSPRIKRGIFDSVI